MINLSNFVLSGIKETGIFNKSTFDKIGELKVYSYSQKGIDGEINIYNLKKGEKEMTWVGSQGAVPDKKEVQSQYFGEKISFGMISSPNYKENKK
jgi:hypothetical protein